MFRNQYDTDVTTWSPQGRLHQMEYAMEAVKQGSACAGCRSDTHVVIAGLKRATSELSSFQRKVFKIDDHMGIAAAGLIGDGRVLSRYMRNECINHRFVYDAPLPVGRLVGQIADKSQQNTQQSWKRPYGVGLLVAGYDKTGPHLYQTCPSGNYYEYKAIAIGARSQASKTYLEKKYETFPSATLDELARHALLALREACLDKEGDLTTKNCTLAIVGKDTVLQVLEDDALKPYLDKLEPPAEGGAAAAAGGDAMEAEGAAAGAGAAAAPADGEPAPMET